MTRVPRIMARLVRPTPTWQLKSSEGSGRDASWPRDKLGLSWTTGGESVSRARQEVNEKTFTFTPNLAEMHSFI